MTDALAHTRTNAWMATYTGKRFDPANPKADDIDPVDIAHALSLICRFGGHVNGFYSVAEHCWLMSYAVPPEDALYALLHDATEAYVGDMVRPLKLRMDDYREIEGWVWCAIVDRFNLPTTAVPQSVTDADNAILLAERDALMPMAPRDWYQDGRYEPLDVHIHRFQPASAEVYYGTRLAELTGGRQ